MRKGEEKWPSMTGSTREVLYQQSDECPSFCPVSGREKEREPLPPPSQPSTTFYMAHTVPRAIEWCRLIYWTRPGRQLTLMMALC